MTELNKEALIAASDEYAQLCSGWISDEALERVIRAYLSALPAVSDVAAKEVPSSEMKRVRAALTQAEFWLNGALTCTAWHWDADQHEAASYSLERIRVALASLPDRTGEPVEIAEVVAKAAQIAGDACWSRPMPKDWDRDKDAYTDWCAEQSKFVREKILALATPPDAEQARLRERVARLQEGEARLSLLLNETALARDAAEARLAQAERAPAGGKG